MVATPTRLKKGSWVVSLRAPARSGGTAEARTSSRCIPEEGRFFQFQSLSAGIDQKPGLKRQAVHYPMQPGLVFQRSFAGSEAQTQRALSLCRLTESPARFSISPQAGLKARYCQTNLG